MAKCPPFVKEESSFFAFPSSSLRQAGADEEANYLLNDREHARGLNDQ